MKRAQGLWHAGKLQGHAKAEYHDGSAYEGDFFNGLRVGHGVCTLPNGDLYVGAWENDMQHGYGEICFFVLFFISLFGLVSLYLCIL